MANALQKAGLISKSQANTVEQEFNAQEKRREELSRQQAAGPRRESDGAKKS